MKESGIDWIGQIPEEWEVTRIKNIVSIERGASPRPIDKFISDDDTGVNWIRIGDTYKGSKYITSTKLKITNRGKQFSRYIHPGTLILSNSMSFGEPYISSIYGCIHDGWLSLAPNNNISKEYLYWLLLSDVCTSQFNLVSIGAVVENLSVDKVGNTLVSMPYSLYEQQKIADFLDKKTAQLDKVKALLEEQIQKLKDYRASLIYETVTKGLDKTVPMKDSGIDWIGQVPQGWGVDFANHIFEEHKQKNKGNKEKNLLSLSYGRIIRKSIDSSFGLLPESFDTYNIIQRGDIVLRLTDLQNDKKSLRVGLARENGIITSAYLTLRLKSIGCSDSYMYYLLHTYDICKVFYNFGGGVRQGGTWSDIYKLELLIPPYNEQTKITDFLNKKTVQIDKLIKIKNQQIENINKQRQTLIYDYVTGKRRV